MNKIREFILILSTTFLHVSGFQVNNPLISGDNVVLLAGLFVILISPELNRVKLSKTSKVAFYFGVFNILVLPLYIQIKNTLFIDVPTVVGFEETTSEVFRIMPFVRMFLRLIIVYNFCKYLSMDKKYFIRGMNALLWGCFIIVLSMIFAPLFTSLGFMMKQSMKLNIVNETIRYTGVTGMLVNSTGTMLSMFLGLSFYMFHKFFLSLYKLIFFSLFLFIGILLTGSRVALSIVFPIYILFQLEIKKKLTLREILFIILFFIISYMIIEKFGSLTINRFIEYSDYGYGGLGLRITYWEIYLKDIMSNLDYLILGNTDWPLYKRSPHNFFIYIVFSSGLLISYIHFYFLLKIIRYRRKFIIKKGLDSFNPLYIIIPLLMFWGTSLEPITWFGLILLTASGISFNEENNSLIKLQ